MKIPFDRSCLRSALERMDIADIAQATIRQSDSHDDWFVYNKVAILAEERIALAVHREDAFVHVTIDTAA